MSAPEDDKRPLPSIDEINAYLEQSAARTKKRLPLAFGTKGAPKAPVRERKLRVSGPKPEGTAPAVSPAVPELLPELAPDTDASPQASAPVSSTPATKPSRT